jgi:hypothetical protein
LASQAALSQCHRPHFGPRCRVALLVGRLLPPHSAPRNRVHSPRMDAKGNSHHVGPGGSSLWSMACSTRPRRPGRQTARSQCKDGDQSGQRRLHVQPVPSSSNNRL